jgi:hypothetical protein
LTDPKRKPLYQPWNEEAFRADVQVYAMAPVQRWMYRTLLQSAFFCSTRPYLPDDDTQLWMLAGCESHKQWDRNKDTVRAMFTPVELDGARLLSRKRLVEDWNRLEEKRQMLAENGRRGRKAQLASSNSPANVEQIPGNCPADAGLLLGKEVKGSKGSEVSKENHSSEAIASDGQVSKSTARKNESIQAFDGFWSLYPRKEAKQAALRAWRKVKADELAAILAALRIATHTEQWQKDGGQFVPLPASWLNGRRWEDEVSIEKRAPLTMPQRRSEIPREENARPFLPPMPPIPCAPKH